MPNAIKYKHVNQLNKKWKLYAECQDRTHDLPIQKPSKANPSVLPLYYADTTRGRDNIAVIYIILYLSQPMMSFVPDLILAEVYKLQIGSEINN